MGTLRFSYAVLSAATVTADVAMPLLLKDAGASNFQIGLTVSLFSFVMGISLYFWGALYNKYKVRNSLAVFGIISSALLFYFMIVSKDATSIMLLRVIQPVFIAAATTILSVSILDRYRKKITYGMKQIYLALGTGSLIGMALGYILTKGYALDEIFFMVALLTLLSSASIITIKDNVKNAIALKNNWRAVLSKDRLPSLGFTHNISFSPLFFIRRPHLLLPKKGMFIILLSMGLLFLGNSAVFTFLPILIKETLNLSSVFLSFFVGGLFVLFSYKISPGIIEKIGLRKTLLLGIFGKSVALLLFIFSNTLLGFLLVLLISGSTSGIIKISASSTVLFDKKKEQIPKSLGAYRGVTFVGMSLGPIIGSFILTLGGYTAIFIFGSALSLISLLLSYTYKKL